MLTTVLANGRLSLPNMSKQVITIARLNHAFGKGALRKPLLSTDIN